MIVAIQWAVLLNTATSRSPAKATAKVAAVRVTANFLRAQAAMVGAPRQSWVVANLEATVANHHLLGAHNLVTIQAAQLQHQQQHGDHSLATTGTCLDMYWTVSCSSALHHFVLTYKDISAQLQLPVTACCTGLAVADEVNSPWRVLKCYVYMQRAMHATLGEKSLLAQNTVPVVFFCCQYTRCTMCLLERPAEGNR